MSKNHPSLTAHTTHTTPATNTSAVLVADIGGSRIKCGLVMNQQVLARRTIDAHAEAGLAARLPAIAQAWQQCEVEAQVTASYAAMALQWQLILLVGMC